MSYDLYIGEAVISADDYEVSVCVKHVEHPDAPEFPYGSDADGPDLSEKTNGRYPAYSAMSLWAQEAGLYDLFFDKEKGLIRKHPGVVLLKPKHLKTLRMAKKVYDIKHPDSIPGWGEGYDAVKARLIWFEFWFDWALKNCKIPVFYNS